MIPGAGKTDQLTVYMCLPLLDMGYHLYVDNWYTSLRLFHFLHRRSTGACGTLRKNRGPAAIRDAQTAVGESSARRSGDLLVIKYRPKPTKNVYVCTTIHSEETRLVEQGRGRNRAPVSKPTAILDYNKYMGGVDKVDQVSVSTYHRPFLCFTCLPYESIMIPCNVAI